MSSTLKAQLRATYLFARSHGLLAREAFAIALASVRIPARRSHYLSAFHHIAN